MTDTANNNLRPGSITSLIAELNVGESMSRVRAVDPTLTIARMPEELPMIREQLRSVVQPSIRRVNVLYPRHRYTCEVGDVVMPGGTFYVVAVVTRVE